MGRVVDLSVVGLQIPDPILVDANVVTAPLFAAYRAQNPVGPVRANQFFQSLIANGGVGVVTPTALNEVIHVAIKAKYDQELAANRPALVATYGAKRRYTWLDLYKIDPTILQGYAADLERLRQRLGTIHLLCLSHDDLGESPAGRSYDRDLVRLVGSYGLDTGDAAILLEAQRAGISDIVTLDRDMRRAQADFDV